MPVRIIADPEGGVPGTWEEKDGSRARGTYRYAAYVYGPDEVPYSAAKPMSELRAKYWDPARQALVIPFTRGTTFTFGPKLLSQTTDTTMVQIQIEFQYAYKGPPPEVCSCGKLSFRHAVEFHDSETSDGSLGSTTVTSERWRAEPSSCDEKGPIIHR